MKSGELVRKVNVLIKQTVEYSRNQNKYHDLTTNKVSDFVKLNLLNPPPERIEGKREFSYDDKHVRIVFLAWTRILFYGTKPSIAFEYAYERYNDHQTELFI